MSSIPGSGRSPGEGNGWLPTPVFLPGEFHRGGRLQSMESQRVEQDWWTNSNTPWVRGCQPRRYNNFIQTQIMSCYLAFYQDFYISNHPPSTQLGFFSPLCLIFLAVTLFSSLSLFLCLSLWFDLFFLLFSAARVEPGDDVGMLIFKGKDLSLRLKRQTHPLQPSEGECCPPAPQTPAWY